MIQVDSLEVAVRVNKRGHSMGASYVWPHNPSHSSGFTRDCGGPNIRLWEEAIVKELR